MFVATFSKIVIISRTNLSKRLGIIPLTIPAEKLLTDMKASVLIVQNFGEINIYDLKSLREVHTVAQSPRFVFVVCVRLPVQRPWVRVLTKADEKYHLNLFINSASFRTLNQVFCTGYRPMLSSPRQTGFN